jgi:hypothetical protein
MYSRYSSRYDCCKSEQLPDNAILSLVDGPISLNFQIFSDITISMLTKFAAVVFFTPIFLLPGLAVAGLGAWYGSLYLKAQLCVKREMSNARSPVLGHFGAAVAGRVSIRAYNAQNSFKSEVGAVPSTNSIISSRSGHEIVVEADRQLHSSCAYLLHLAMLD